MPRASSTGNRSQPPGLGPSIAHARRVSDRVGRVAIDVAPLRAQPAGVGLYVENLARELIASDLVDVALVGLRREASAFRALPEDTRVVAFTGRRYHAWLQLR